MTDRPTAAGQILKASSTKEATWATAPQVNFYNPTALGSPTGRTGDVMVGLGSTAVITPTGSGRINVLATFSFVNNNSNVTTFTLNYGTGTAPTNNDAPAGTICGTLGPVEPKSTTKVATAAVVGSFVGTVGTPYWIDIESNTTSSGGFTTTLSVISIRITEEA